VILIAFLLLWVLIFLPGFSSGFHRVIFRAWIPAWRYFDIEGAVPRLSVREWTSHSGASTWKKIDVVHGIRSHEFLLNPLGNMILLQDSQLRLFLSDPDDFQFVLEGRVRAEIEKLGLGWAQFQYRVSLYDLAKGTEEDAFCSAALSLRGSS
jgi:hypothetical protein